MRYKLALIDPKGTVIESWFVTVDPKAEINDEYNLTKSIAVSCLMDDIKYEMQANDKKH